MTPCGCRCLTLFACHGCMWRLVAPSGGRGETRCTVCRGGFSDAAVLLACRHGVEGAAALEGAGAEEARHDALQGVMETLLKLEDADGALALARGVVAEQEAVFGAEHLTAVHFRLMLGHVLSRFERDAEAVGIFDACALAQAVMVQSWDAAAPSASDRKWMHRTMRSRLNAAMHRITAAETAEAAGVVTNPAARASERQYVERELFDAYTRLHELLGPVHRDSLAAIFMFAKEIAERVLRELDGAPARTRGQHAQLRVARSAVDAGLRSAEAAMASLPAGGGAHLSVVREHMLEHHAALAEAAGAAGPA